MEYQYSEDGVTFYDVPNVERGLYDDRAMAVMGTRR